MKNPISFLSALLMVGCLLLGSNLTAQNKQIQESFDGITEIELQVGSGDIHLQKGSSDAIEVQGEYDDDQVEVKIKVNGKKLTIEEKSKRNQQSKASDWTLQIPDNIKLNLNVGTGNIDMENIAVDMKGNAGTGSFQLDKVSGNMNLNSGTGNFRLNQVNGEMHLNSGTGNIQVEASEGMFQLNSGTGRVAIAASKGTFTANSGTGNVKGQDLEVTGASSLNSGTGDAMLTLTAAPAANVSINSGTGDAELDFDTRNFKGTLTMVCSEKGGKIVAPFKFDQEEVKGEGRNKTIHKTKVFGEAGTAIKVGSGTGTAKVK